MERVELAFGGPQSNQKGSGVGVFENSLIDDLVEEHCLGMGQALVFSKRSELKKSPGAVYHCWS